MAKQKPTLGRARGHIQKNLYNLCEEPHWRPFNGRALSVGALSRAVPFKILRLFKDFLYTLHLDLRRIVVFC